MIEYVNHPPFGVTSDAQWQRCAAAWIQALRHPSYLRVGGKPVLKIHGGSLFLKQAGGTPAQSKTRLDSLRQAARQAGLGELLIGCGVGSGEAIPAGHWAAQVYDFSACYMDVPPQTPREADYPWELLARWTAERRPAHLQDAIPYLPYLAAGWSPRPWSDPRPAFAPPDRVQWRAALQEMKEDLARGRFGLPLPDGRVQPACTIYVAPTQGDRSMKLEEIRRVFPRDPPSRGRTAMPTP
jgi:hypothetical protein